MKIEFEIPFPVSTNRLYRTRGRRVLLSREARVFYETVKRLLHIKGIPQVKGSIEVEIDLYPKSKQFFDVDNRIKSTLDAIQRAGVIEDDKHVVKVTARKCEVSPLPKAIVRIKNVDCNG